MVLPFGMSLAPRTFTKCMDSALSPLRQMGIRILNYLGDWLILAQSEVELLSHRSPPSQPLGVPGTQDQLWPRSALSPSHGYCSWNSFRLGPNEGCGHARACSGHTAARGLFRDRSLSPSQIVSENAGPHGPSATAGPASYAAPSALAETEGSIRRLGAFQTSPRAWCSIHGTDPVFCDISLILSFLQELLDKGCSPSTFKVYVAAIAASQASYSGPVVGRTNLVF